MLTESNKNYFSSFLAAKTAGRKNDLEEFWKTGNSCDEDGGRFEDAKNYVLQTRLPKNASWSLVRQMTLAVAPLEQ